MALCIEATLVGMAMSATLTPTGVADATLESKPASAVIANGGFGSATLSSTPSSATLSGRAVEAYFTVSCPIDYITSCFSLGGWDDNLGWDDDLGWKD